MSNSCFKVAQNMKQSQFEIFVRDPQADSLVILSNKTYLMRKNLLFKCGYFHKMMEDQNIFFIANHQIENQVFLRIMITLYGTKLNFRKDWQIIEILKISQFLQYEAIFEQIILDIEKNFEDYGLFLLYFIGQTYKIKWLQQKCDQQLRIFQYQQLNFSKYDLFQLKLHFFIDIIKKHQNLKQKGHIKGLSQKNIKKIIAQYSETNNCQLKAQQVMALTTDDVFKIETTQKQRQNQFTKKMQGLIRKRTKTWDECSTTQLQSLKNISKKLSNAKSQPKKSQIRFSKQIKQEINKIKMNQSNLAYPQTPSTNHDDNQASQLWCIDSQNESKFVSHHQPVYIVNSNQIRSIFRN